MIRFENVTKRYKNNLVLDKINLEIPKGKIVVLIGASGCGKTTCLKMINRLIDQSDGKIYINNEEIENKDPIKLRRNIGYVIQQVGLFPHMTVKENIEIIPKLEKFDASVITSRTEELMKMIGLDGESFMHRYPVQLSGGQQQRIGVARAFAINAEIILMDEPFSALDPITRLQLQDELMTLQSELHRTIVFVTHDMDEAIRIADKICIMNNGKILQYDTPEMILKHPVDDFVKEFVGEKRIWNQPDMIKAQDIMIASPITAHGDISLLRAVEIMRTSKVDSILVIDSKHELLGILFSSILKKGDGIKWEAPISSIMRKDYPTASLTDSILDLLNVFNSENVSIIPIVDENKKLLGLITRSSLITTLSQQFLVDEVNDND